MPTRLVEVDGEEPAGLVRQQRINADRVFADQVGPNDEVGHADVRLRGALLHTCPPRAARAGCELLEAAGSVRHEGGPQLTQLEAALPDGSVFVVRDSGNTVVAATTPEPTVGLVFYDLKSCLRALSAEQESGPATSESDAAA